MHAERACSVTGSMAARHLAEPYVSGGRAAIFDHTVRGALSPLSASTRHLGYQAVKARRPLRLSQKQNDEARRGRYPHLGYSRYCALIIFIY